MNGKTIVDDMDDNDKIFLKFSHDVLNTHFYNNCIIIDVERTVNISYNIN